MRRPMLMLALVLAGLPGGAHAEWKEVTRQESKLLIVAPLLEGGREIYRYGGWDASGGYESSFAAILPARGAYPEMQVYFNRMAALHQWGSGSALDEKGLKRSFSFLGEKTIHITAAAPQPGRYLRVVRFAVDQSECAAFEMRQLDINNSIKSDAERNSITGLYCAPAGVPLTDDLVRQATEGIYVRGDSGVERMLKGVARPVPASLM
jgi:hypothetical protein